MRAIAFIDYENIWMGLTERGYKLRPEAFIRVLENYAEKTMIDLKEVYLYANFNKEEFWRTQTAFENKGIYTRHIFGKNSLTNTEVQHNAADLELMLEAHEILLTRASTLDLFLLFTGDGDFFSLVRKIRAWGKDVKIIGVNENVPKTLEPYSESFDVFCNLINSDGNVRYKLEEDVEQAIRIITELQLTMPYIASTRARMVLSKRMNRSQKYIKDLVQLLVEKKLIIEMEHADPNLIIKKTKIYLLNLANALIASILQNEHMIELKKRYDRLNEINQAG
ncbi:MAG: NYN domain-containing protein [Peptococcaceae bacterium]|nr:NYN domain-containing protein [Peptococcaceae bacterium]